MSQSREAVLNALVTLLQGLGSSPDVSPNPRPLEQLSGFPAIDILWSGGNFVYEVTGEYASRERITLRLCVNSETQAAAQTELFALCEAITDALVQDATLGETCTGCWPVSTDMWLLAYQPPYIAFLPLECDLRRDYPDGN